MNSDPFRGCQLKPYWLDDAPLEEGFGDKVPATIDLLVVGSGYTGLSAAIEAAAGGMSVLVADRGNIGAGCSSRNGGQVSTSIKPSLSALTKKHGERVAAEVRQEGRNALEFVPHLIDKLKIECSWSNTGRYFAAHSPAEFDNLCKKAEAAEAEGELPSIIVPRSKQLSELNSDRYFGGVINPQFGGIHPARLHAGLVKAARATGVRVAGHCEVKSISQENGRFSVLTSRGVVSARKVLIATNGYTGSLSPWHQRRIIPIGSYVLATEPLAPEVSKALIPNQRMVVDTRKLVVYFRLSPDGQRVIFGGRAALSESDPRKSLPRLYQMMLDIFPHLKGTAVTHTWNGYVAYTFDTLPHFGVRDGVHYAMGYCGSGISLSLYFGMRAGQKILGRPEGRTALEEVTFQTRPFYNGNPWFLAPSVLFYRVMDRLSF